MRFIGDVHGKFDQYLDIIQNVSESVQVGDFGVGFKPLPTILGATGLFETSRHKFIRGNHDNPALCAESPNWIPDGDVFPSDGVMFIGGALSIDKQERMEGVGWWHDEECTISKLNDCLDRYERFGPAIVVTHDCPESVTAKLFGSDGKRDYPSRTRQAFDAILDICPPKLWIFGHWHRSRNEMIGDTRYICLAELEFKDIEL